MKKSELVEIQKLVETLVEQVLQDKGVNNKSDIKEDSADNKDKQRVKRFFDKLEKSSLRNFLKFGTAQEQAQAILRFANMVGVPKSKLAVMMASLRASSKNNDAVNEMMVVNKETGEDVTKHILDLLAGKIDKKEFEKLTGIKK